MTDIAAKELRLRSQTRWNADNRPSMSGFRTQRCILVYMGCALPFVIGAALGYLQWGLIASLALAMSAAILAGYRWLLPVFFAFLPFHQSIVPSNVNIACTDVISAALCILLVTHMGRVRFGLETVALSMYLAVSAIASTRTINEPYTFISLARMVAATVVPLLAFATLDNKGWAVARSFLLYILSTTLLSGFIIYEFLAHGIDKAMYTLDLHKNAMGSTFAVAIVVVSGAALLAWSQIPRRTMIAVLGLNALALLLTLSRSGWMGCACGLACLMFLTHRVRTAVAIAIPAIAVVAAAWQFIPQDRREYASDISLSAGTVKSRVQSMSLVMDQFGDSPLIGVGVGLRKYVEPHNMFVLNLGETGVVGTALLLVALGFGVRTLLGSRMNPARRDFDQVLIRTIGTAVLVATVVHGCFDVYWRRGVSAAGWAAVGMAMAANRRPHPSQIRRCTSCTV